ncbi:MAG: hypothetical protein HY318_03100 [Armatimonadetes bacterium]|nr:hypothetical protein [Armatimonadota bacterium]
MIQTGNPREKLHGISPVTLIVGVLGCIAACLVVPYAELVLQIQIGICQFAPAAIGLFLVVVGLNQLARKLNPRCFLDSAQMSVVYCMIVVATLLSSRGLLGKLIPTLAMTSYYASPENRWGTTIFPHLPQWMFPFGVENPKPQPVIEQYFQGLRKGNRIPWLPWVVPLTAWYVFACCIFMTWGCLASLLRKQWADNEKLTFPLVQLPLELADQDSLRSFFRNRLMWIGFSIPAFVFLANGLHQLYPAIPEIKLQVPLNPFFTSKPWSDVSYTTLFLSFAAMGFCYFLPTQLLFSLWFFFLFSRGEDLMVSLLGKPVDAMPMYPTRLYMGYQIMGAYVVLFAYLVRSGWPHLKSVLRKVLVDDPALDDSNELVPHRLAVLGIALGTGGSIAWLIAAGMSPWLAVVEMVVYLFLVGTIMARSVAEAGMIMCETSFRPLDVVRMFSPAHALGSRNLTLLAYPDAAFVRDLRGNLFSTFLDALRIADRVHLRKRHLLGAMMLAVFVVMVFGPFVHLHLPYKKSMLTLYQYGTGNARMLVDDSVRAIQNPDVYDVRRPANFALGAVFSLFLTIMRTRFYWWPLYPIGFALCGSWTIIVFWFPIFLTWIIKSVMLRYWGMKVYQNGRPLFLGMILGEFFMAVLWTVICSIIRKPAPFFPWP